MVSEVLGRTLGVDGRFSGSHLQTYLHLTSVNANTNTSPKECNTIDVTSTKHGSIATSVLEPFLIKDNVRIFISSVFNVTSVKHSQSNLCKEM